jgi:hypothetical protein
MRASLLLAGTTLVVFACTTTPTPPSQPQSLEQVIYADCLPVETAVAKREQKDQPAIYAHYLCKIFAGACGNNPHGSDCKKGIDAYDHERKGVGPSQLYRAADGGDTALLTQLLEIGFDPNTPLGPPGWTPLLIAAANGHEQAVSKLLEFGADVNALNDRGRSALMFAANYGFEAIAKALLLHGADPNIQPSGWPSWNALMVASAKGHGTIVTLLLDHGADTVPKDENGLTAYALAKKQDQQEIVQLFENRGITQ